MITQVIKATPIPNTVDVLADNTVASSAPTKKALVVQGEIGQIANIAEIQDSNGKVLASFDKNGNLSAPNLITTSLIFG